MTLDQVVKSVQNLLDEDLEHCIDQAFEKLDIRDESKISLKVIKQALYSTLKLHNKT